MQKRPLQTLDRIEYRATASSELSLIYRQTVTTFLGRWSFDWFTLKLNLAEPVSSAFIHFQVGRGPHETPARHRS